MSADHGLEDILPLAPLQEGLLFHADLSDTGGAPGATHGLDVYTMRLVFRLDGDLDTTALRRATDTVLDRHPHLRAAFLQEGLDRPVQAIPGRPRCPGGRSTCGAPPPTGSGPRSSGSWTRSADTAST